MGSDYDIEDVQEQEVSSSDSSRREDSDLAQLRSLNDGECSADWYNFQESLAQLQVLEELIQEKQAVLEELSSKAKAFRECMKNEEEQSNRMRHSISTYKLVIFIILVH